MVALFLALLGAMPIELAPMPRAKADAACLQCDESDVRCRARAALALHSASVNITVPKVMPSAAAMAARSALEQADRAIKATPKVPAKGP